MPGSPQRPWKSQSSELGLLLLPYAKPSWVLSDKLYGLGVAATAHEHPHDHEESKSAAVRANHNDVRARASPWGRGRRTGCR